MMVLKNNHLADIKAIIYVNKRVSISLVQRKLKLSYLAVVKLLESLDKERVLITDNGERQINWQHSDWQKFIEQPKLLAAWLEEDVANELSQYSVQQNDQGWWYIVAETNRSQRVVSFVETQEAGLLWLAENKKG